MTAALESYLYIYSPVAQLKQDSLSLSLISLPSSCIRLEMERYRETPNHKGSLSQKLDNSFHVSTAPSYISLPPKHHVREPPFPSYIPKNPTTTTTTDRLPRRAADDAEISIFDAERYFNEAEDARPEAGKKTFILEGIISERCDLSTNPRDSSVSSVDGYGRNYRNGSFHATPTASSEASWNSQHGLLANSKGSAAVRVRALSQRKGSSSSSRRWLFGRKCPCSGKKSVEVEDCSEPKTPSHSNHNPSIPIRATHTPNVYLGAAKMPQSYEFVEREKKDAILGVDEVIKLKILAGAWSKDEEAVRGSGRISPEKAFPPETARRIVNSGVGFSFPVLAPPAAGSAEDDPARDSLEVFRPPELQRRMPAFNPRPSDDDAASDASSDLFEIESFSTQPTSRRRDSLDEAAFDRRRFTGSAAAAEILQFRRSLEEEAAGTASIAPSECYPPSEVSVQWSVTTAEGGFERGSAANFSSAASEYEELRFIQEDNERLAADAAAAAAGGGRRRRGSGLLSCVCEKAVNVGPSPVRLPEQRRPSVFEPERSSGMGMARHGPVADRQGIVRSYSSQVGRTLQIR